MIKLLTIGILLVLLYRLLFASGKSLPTSEKQNINKGTDDDVIDIDYEDVE